MESRTVKFNIKQFLEDYMYCIESKDCDEQEELINKFKRVYNSSNPTVKQGIKNYVNKSGYVRDYPEISLLMGAF